MLRFISFALLTVSALAGAQERQLGDRVLRPGGSEDGGIIKILDARYGRDETHCRAADDVARACDGRDACEINASDELCGNSYTNVSKELFIAYQCNAAERRTVTVDQGQTAKVFCAGGGGADDQPIGGKPLPGFGDQQPPSRWARDRIYVDSAQYGFSQRTCEMTNYFRDRCEGQQSCEVSANNDLCGDPAKGYRKEALFTYWCNGDQQSQSVREGQSTTISCR